MSYDRPLNANDYPIRAVGPSLYRRTASSPIAVLPSRDLAADVAARLNATLAPTAPEPTQWPARRPVTLRDVADGMVPGASVVFGERVVEHWPPQPPSDLR